jgi:hypothetical protein
MKIYTAHRPPHAPRDRALFVKEGFSWPAFLVPVVWLVVKRLWLPLALYVLAVVVLSVAASAAGLTGGPVVIAALGLNLIFGFEANNLLRRALARRGFSEEGPFVGTDAEEAELKFFQSQPVAQHTPSPPPGMNGPAGVPRPGV